MVLPDVHTLLANQDEPFAREVVLTPNGMKACIDVVEASSEQFELWAKEELDPYLPINEDRSYIYIAHDLGDILQQTAMILMATAYVGQPDKYEFWCRMKGEPDDETLEEGGFLVELKKAFYESAQGQMFPFIKRLK